MKEYKYKVKGAEYTVKINDVEGNMAQVEVNGIPFEVEMERPMHLTHKPVTGSAARSPGRERYGRPCPAARHGECRGCQRGTSREERTDRGGARSHEDGKQYQCRVRRYGNGRACKQGRLGA